MIARMFTVALAGLVLSSPVAVADGRVPALYEVRVTNVTSGVYFTPTLAATHVPGVRMFALTSEFARVTAPLLHDSNTDGTGDREFRYRNSWGWTFARPMQRIARVDGMQWSDTGRFIRRLPAPRNDVYGEPTIVGSVDMQSYSAWLAANYGVRVQWTP